MSDIMERKAEHIQVCLEESVESGVTGGLGSWRLRYRALPEIALDDVDLTTSIAGKTLRAPLIIGAMTGGHSEAGAFNRQLAAAAERCGVGFALGSGRVAIERAEAMASFQVRDVAPTALIFANLGAVQLNYGVSAADVARLVAETGADAINLHLNPLQEAVQPQGDTNFRHLAPQMHALADALDVPVFVKEVGAGIGRHTAELLAAMPIAGVECAGVGGTSWARVEAKRVGSDAQASAAGIALGAIGIPTAESLLVCRETMPDRVVICSGGLRTAIDMGTALALGADAVACALPFLKAVNDGGEEAVVEVIQTYIHQLRILHFVCGATRPSEMRGRVSRVDSSGLARP